MSLKTNIINKKIEKIVKKIDKSGVVGLEERNVELIPLLISKGIKVLECNYQNRVVFNCFKDPKKLSSTLKDLYSRILNGIRETNGMIFYDVKDICSFTEHVEKIFEEINFARHWFFPEVDENGCMLVSSLTDENIEFVKFVPMNFESLREYCVSLHIEKDRIYIKPICSKFRAIYNTHK